MSSASIKFLWLRQIHDPSGISPALDNALSTLLSCCSQHFFPVRVLASFIHFLPVVTLSDNDSKQIAAATSFCMSNTKNFFSEGQKNLVNLENKENLSNYQLLRRKPSLWSTSLPFSKLITVVQSFFPVTPILIWYQVGINIQFWRGKFSRPATGYECIAHPLAFDRGVDIFQRPKEGEKRDPGNEVSRHNVLIFFLLTFRIVFGFSLPIILASLSY